MSESSEKASHDTIMAMAMAEEIDKLRAENDLLHKRRGELVIERDRYKAALAEYPEGRDVLLGGALAEIENLRASYAAIIQWLMGQGLLVRHSMCTRPDNTFGPAWVLRRVHSVAGDSCLGWDKDDPVAAVEAALKVTR